MDSFHRFPIITDYSNPLSMLPFRRDAISVCYVALEREGNNWHLQEHRKNINDRDSNAISCGEGVICSSNRVDRQNNVKSSCW